MEVREFQLKDIHNIEMQEIEKAQGFDDEEVMLLRRYPSFSLIKDGLVIAILGIVLLKNNIGIVWLIPSVYVGKNNTKSFSIIAKQYVRAFQSTFNLNKMMTECINDPKRIRFLEWLGFKHSKNPGIYILEV